MLLGRDPGPARPQARLGAALLLLGAAGGFEGGACAGGAPECGDGGAGPPPSGPGARDFDGDGYADVAVGAPASGTIAGGPGRVYVFRGGAGDRFDPGPDGTLSGADPLELFGMDVEYVGDFDGDGLADLAVAARWTSPSTPDEWRVYLWLGRAQPRFEQAPDLYFAGPIEESEAAYPWLRLEAAADLNGDGYDDFMIGQNATPDGPLALLGSITVFFGGAAPDASPDGVLWGPAPGTRFGLAMAAGDLDGDSYADLIAGAPRAPGIDSPGSVLVYRGGPGTELEANPDLTRIGSSPLEYLGWSVAVPGDLNGDGFADLVARASAAAHVIFGGPALDLETDGIVPATGDVAPAGDTNGDGYADLMVASGSFPTGQYSLYLGGPGDAFDTTRDGLLGGGPDELSWYGPFSPAGDLNGDGLDDVVANAIDGGEGIGRALVYFGHAEVGVDATGTLLQGTVPYDFFGAALALAR